MEIVSQGLYLRISPKKTKFLIEAIKKLSPAEAINVLEFKVKSGSQELVKLIKSALSNAKNNYKLNAESLYFKRIEVLKGPAFKRWQPVSRGMAHQFKKRTSHIRIILSGKQAAESKTGPSRPNQVKPLIKREKGKKNGTKS